MRANAICKLDPLLAVDQAGPVAIDPIALNPHEGKTKLEAFALLWGQCRSTCLRHRRKHVHTAAEIFRKEQRAEGGTLRAPSSTASCGARPINRPRVVLA